MSAVRRRLERYFDVMYIDEVQDFAGHDFNLLMALCRTTVGVLLVGDFYQHTYDTSRDGSVNKNLHASYAAYLERLRREELRVDTTSLSKSYRCAGTVCEFIQTNMGIAMRSASKRTAKVAWIDNAVHAQELHVCAKTVKLFYQEHYRYGCNSQNWGGSKGLDHYEDVCVVLNQKAVTELHAGRFALLSPTTRNKIYVACSRARGDLYLVAENLMRPFKCVST
jgi:DNA helicase-2/ATP-dependent DNA helicase PcrA